MNISFCITVCNEHQELQELLAQLLTSLKEDDEILVQADEDNHTKEVESVMNKFSDEDPRVKQLFFPLRKDFAHFKNNLFNYAKNDYICFIDADEKFSNSLLDNLHAVIEMNPVDLIVVPRANTVEGLTTEHINKWGWRVDNGLVNWPDYQMRIVKNNNNMRWQGKVHERIVGFTTISHLPHDNQDWCLLHPKTIERQEKQNQLYNTL
jgi:glycosyltransferase involved in cell wall biosynthesis